MWPWEHLAVGYLAYTALSRLVFRAPPTTGGAVAVALGTQFPDLVDKPLGWWLGVVPGGTTVAHSLLTAVPLCLLVLLVAVPTGRGRLAVAFAVGYLSHLPGDVLYPVVLGGDPKLWFLLWPLTPAPGSGPSAVLPHFFELVELFAAFLSTPLGAVYLVSELLFLAVAVRVWFLDGSPGLEWTPLRASRVKKL
ncbi:metal-dependent hydrolase [Halosimplex salinum]|uniref:metal-dependent hydrolase n=1 Tax=Halosimplex salinum TaxID=1710538 RepID=UPI000F477AAD|nr:metal-dependent hydrolase [Halosimplex salinum]